MNPGQSMTTRGLRSRRGRTSVPWYELRLRGGLESSSGLVPGFQVVEQMVTTVLCGRVDEPADIQPVLAEVQALGLEVTEFHQVPERPAHAPLRDVSAAGRSRCRTDDRIDLVVLDLPSTHLPPTVTHGLASLAKAELIDVVDVARVERRADGSLVRRAAPSGLPKRVEWQLRRNTGWTMPVTSLAGHLAGLGPGEGVLVVALRRRSPVDLLEAAAAVAGGGVASCLTVPDFEQAADPSDQPNAR